MMLAYPRVMYACLSTLGSPKSGRFSCCSSDSSTARHTAIIVSEMATTRIFPLQKVLGEFFSTATLWCVEERGSGGRARAQVHPGGRAQARAQVHPYRCQKQMAALCLLGAAWFLPSREGRGRKRRRNGGMSWNNDRGPFWQGYRSRMIMSVTHARTYMHTHAHTCTHTRTHTHTHTHTHNHIHSIAPLFFCQVLHVNLTRELPTVPVTWAF